MIILKLAEDVNEKKRRGFRKRKIKEELFDYSRAGVIINNKPHFIISVKEDCLCDERFRGLLERYKGEIVAGEKLSENEFVKELLFDEKPYLKKAVFQTFRKIFDTEKSKSFDVLVCDKNFILKDDLPQILPRIKSLTVKASDEFLLKEWQRECFLEFGVKPKIICDDSSVFFGYDVVADFDNIKNRALELEFLGEYKIITPDSSYMRVSDELKFLKNFELENSTICAAFGTCLKK